MGWLSHGDAALMNRLNASSFKDEERGVSRTHIKVSSSSITSGVLLVTPIAAITGASVWRHWTTADIIHSTTEYVDQLPKLVDDIIAFREDHGNFPLSEDALKCLELFPEGHEVQVHIIHTSRTLA